MTTLIVGASGATGKHLVEQLLIMEQKVKVIVRSAEKLPESWKNNKQVVIVQANVLDITKADMAELLKGCDAVASCLGHNITWKGMFGEPRKLVTDALTLLCAAIKKNGPCIKPIKFVLMNTTGNINRDLNEPNSLGQRFVITLLRLLLPPHVDNEKAADFLRTEIGQENDCVEWVAVRPYNLVNHNKVSNYKVYASPNKSAIFDSRTTSRINVGNFMARLITDNKLWNDWKGQMPVIFNQSLSSKK